MFESLGREYVPQAGFELSSSGFTYKEETSSNPVQAIFSLRLSNAQVGRHKFTLFKTVYSSMNIN